MNENFLLFWASLWVLLLLPVDQLNARDVLFWLLVTDQRKDGLIVGLRNFGGLQRYDVADLCCFLLDQLSLFHMRQQDLHSLVDANLLLPFVPHYLILRRVDVEELLNLERLTEV